MKVLEEINNVLLEVMKENESVYHIGEDIVDPYGGAFKVTKGISSLFPDRVKSTPISESSFVGMSIGMSCRGLLPVVEVMFGDFLTLAFDQIMNNAGKIKYMSNDLMEPSVTVRTPMGAGRGYGPTHSQSLEKHFIGIAGLKILSISTVNDIAAIYRHAILQDKSPKLIVENKALYPVAVRKQGNSGYYNQFIIKEGVLNGYPHTALRLTEKNRVDFTVVSYGGMVEKIIPAIYEIMIEEEISCELIVPSLIYPFDVSMLEDSIKNSGVLVVVEEGTQSGGFSDYISSKVNESYYEYVNYQTIKIAPDDMPIPCSKELEDQYLPSKLSIKEQIIKHHKLRNR